ncbi:MAG: LPS assembly protein LptD [Hyphomonadaceae bacterium]|nr:LPS assembly protein LptD [Hyphomonadaceae bacterium]
MSRSEGIADRTTDRAPGPLAATLAALFLVSAGAGAATAQEPVAATADALVVLEADRLVRDDEAETITAEGNVEARYEGRVLRTQRLVYNLRDNTIRAQGGVEIIDPDGTIRYAEEIEVDSELNTGFSTGFAARLSGGGTTVAAAAVRPSEGRNELRRFVYTACPICKVEGTDKTKGPTWTLRARSAVQDQSTKMISYRDVVFQFGPVPVVYLPFFSHPDPSSGPRSGLLPPDIGTSRRVGGFYEQPYHIQISPFQDLTIAPQFNTKVNPLVGLQYRKRFYSGDLRFEGSFSYDQDFDGNGEKFGNEQLRGHLFGSGLFEINPFWSWGFGVERVADDLYLRRYDIERRSRSRGPYVGDLGRLITQLYTTGQSESTYSSLSLVSFQDVRAVDEQAVPLILPVGEIEHVVDDPFIGGQLRLQASTASLYRADNGVDSSRISSGFEWRKDYILNSGVVLAPFASARGDYYRIGNSPSADNETFGRAVGVTGVEASLPFMRSTERLDVILEPVVMLALGSQGGNDERIVNEDSTAFELDESNLFRPNAAPNFDLWEPGPRASVGVRATARSRDDKAASVFLGRRWREEASPVFSRVTNLDDETSDWVTAASVNLGRNLGAEVRARVSDEDLSLVRLDATVRGELWRFSTEARYFEVDKALRPNDPSREVRAGVGVRVTDRWSLSWGIQRDLDSDITLSQNARLTYQDDCTFIDFAYRRAETFDRVLGPDEGFQIRIGLTSLGVFGGE